MRYLSGEEEKKAINFLLLCAKVALEGTCLRSKGGSIVVKDSEIIGTGCNTPPGGLESQRRCTNDKQAYHFKVTDKTCCAHAEQRAMSDAMLRNPGKHVGATIYFLRLDADGNPQKAGDPYCTGCSKRALDEGLSKFVLWREEGVAEYDTDEYHSLSYEFKG